jgi:hypothetical protein
MLSVSSPPRPLLCVGYWVARTSWAMTLQYHLTRLNITSPVLLPFRLRDRLPHPI